MVKKFALAFAAATGAQAAHWAVIAAGSKAWMNYRHQANACHAYQVLKAKGIPEENIIHFNFDDLAENDRNPFPGKVFNKPDPAGPGVDVYAGCNIDYKEGDVTADNFLRILSGEGDGKVLRSTEDDHVFVYFVGHGVVGMSQFPSLVGAGELPGSAVHKDELHATLKKMSEKKMFKKLVYYLESCHSASMFEDMDVPGVYAVTSANATESGWGTYCHGEGDGNADVINGKHFNTCIGDLFGVSWMESNEALDITAENLADQYSLIKERNNKSNTLKFGDETFGSDPVGDYMGGMGAHHSSTLRLSKSASHVDPLTTAVSADDIELQRFKGAVLSAKTSQERAALEQDLQAELHMREVVQNVYFRMVEIAYPDDLEKQHSVWNAQAKPNRAVCEKSAYNALLGHCADKFNMQSSFPLKFHQVLVNLCAAVPDTKDVAAIVELACDGSSVVV